MNNYENAATLKPISTLTSEEALRIQYVLMDIDDTLTTGGKLYAQSYEALWKLHNANLKVIPVTGRPAGWCDLIVREWPVDGVIGENGAIAFWEAEDHTLESLTHPNAIKNSDARLLSLCEHILSEIPKARIARDQFSRLYDIAIDFAEEKPELSLFEAQRICSMFIQGGAHAKISSIHVNAWMGDYNKLSMAIQFLSTRFGYADTLNADSVVFVGDSPNDEPLFEHFPMSCAVANVFRYREIMTRFPHFVTQRESGSGFSEFADMLIMSRNRRLYD